MDNKPHALTTNEMKEIAEIESIRQMFGAENAAEMQELLDKDVYAVKFNYMSGSPGYFGDYIILQGDAIGDPLELVRNKAGQLVIVDDSTL
jgi:hypothetical protein